MKKLFTLLFTYTLMHIAIICVGQNSYQTSLLKEFFYDRGAKVLNNWAHPLYDRYSSKTTVYVSSDYVSVTLYYIGNAEDFDCTYNISFNSYGVFTAINVSSCGNFWTSCYTFSDWAKENTIRLYETDSKTQERTETQLGKTINYFSSKDYCLLGLNYYWVDDGYYGKY